MEELEVNEAVLSQPESSSPISVLTPQDSELPAISEEPLEVELNEEILQILGDVPKSDVPLGPPVHKDIAARWQDILSKGLPKEAKGKLFQEYPTPNNCSLLLAPVLNPEVKAAVADTIVKRDWFSMQRQKHLCVAISALANVTKMVIANETSQHKILKPLSDACRLLCDLHYMETKSRRQSILISINTTLKGSLLETSRDNFLFGEHLDEKVKAAKVIQRSGEALRTVPRPISNKYHIPRNKGNLNFKPMHRKTDNKLDNYSRTPRPLPQPQRRSRLNQQKTPRSPPLKGIRQR